MTLDLNFSENSQKLDVKFERLQYLTDGGYEQGYADGKQAECDEFWNVYQLNGTRKDYQYAFWGRGWTDENFKPKYPISPTGSYANYMFQNTGLRKSPYLLEIDFSKCTAVILTFHGSTIEELGVLDFRKVQQGWNGLQQTFVNCGNLRKIEKIIMPTTAIQNNGFINCTSLTEIRFEGKLFGQQNFQWCPLSVESMKSIISCLNNYSGTSEELKYRLIFKDECWAELEADSTAPDGGTWEAYINSLGWNS